MGDTGHSVHFLQTRKQEQSGQGLFLPSHPVYSRPLVILGSIVLFYFSFITSISIWNYLVSLLLGSQMMLDKYVSSK